MARKRLGNALLLHAPLGPCDYLGTLSLDAEIATLLVGIEPAVEWNQGDINVPQV